MVLASSRVVELVRAGLPTMHTDRIVDGGRTLEVARVKVNDAGRPAPRMTSKHNRVMIYGPKTDGTYLV
jgi:hypothetical protein